MPKKVRRLALKSAFSLKVPDGAIKVVEDFTFDEPKTKRMAGMTQAIQIDDRKVSLAHAGGGAECPEVLSEFIQPPGTAGSSGLDIRCGQR